VKSGSIITAQYEGLGGTSWASRTVDNAVIANLDAGKITTGTLDANRIAAGTITTEKLTVATLGSVLVGNGGFEDPAGWILGGNASRVTTSPRSGTYCMYLTASGGTGLSSPAFPVAAGDVLSYLAWAKTVVATTGLYLRFSWRNSAGAELGISDVASGVAVGASYTQYGGTATAPANTVSAVVQVYNVSGTVAIDDIDVRKVITGVQIAGNAIDGKTITGAILQTTDTANRGVKIISTDNSGYGAIYGYNNAGGQTFNLNGNTGSLTMVGDLNAGSNVNGATITGGTLQTTSTASRGIKISATGMTAYNSTGTPTFTIDASTGAVAMLGSLTSGSSISGATITGSTLATGSTGQRIVVDNTVIRAYSGVVGETSPAFFDPTSSTRPGLYIQSGLTTTYTEFPLISLLSNTAGNSNTSIYASSFQVLDKSSNQRMRVDSAGTTIWNGLTVNAATTITSGGLNVTAGGVNITGHNDFISLASGGGDNQASGNMFCRVNASGRLFSSTATPSSRDMKKNIRPLAIKPDKVLALEPKTYVYKEAPDFKRTGFIAEEAHDLGLTRFVGYEDNEDPTKPTGFLYEDFVAAHQVVLRDHRDRINTLEAEVAELKAMVKELVGG
jgi:hypothetical protein